MKLDRKTKKQQRENRDYWEKRFVQEQDELFDKSRDEIIKRIAGHYTGALQKIKGDMLEVMDKVAAGDHNMNELYKFNRYADLQRNVNRNLKALGQAEVDIMERSFKKFHERADKAAQAYLKNTGTVKGSFSLVNGKAVEEAVNGVWCSDGQRWSSRIWKNKALLQQSLERGLVDCVTRGSRKEDLAKELMDRMGVAYHEADRVVRTELARIQNMADVRRYEESGVKKVKTVACDDARTCPICRKKDGKITEVDEALPGVAFLFHPNCRCLVVPVVDVPDYTEEDQERLARAEAERLERNAKERAIRGHISGQSYKINEKLRNGKPLTSDEKEYIKDLDEALAEMENYHGDLNRSLWFPNEKAKAKFLEDYAINEPIKYLEYISATKGSVYNPAGQVQIFIEDAKNGKDISKHNKAEQEILYQRGSAFVVRKIVEKDNKAWILLEEITNG